MSEQRKPRIEFTRAQLEFLDNHFPELVGTPSTTDSEFRWRAAQRSVLAFLRTRVTKTVGE